MMRLNITHSRSKLRHVRHLYQRYLQNAAYFVDAVPVPAPSVQGIGCAIQLSSNGPLPAYCTSTVKIAQKEWHQNHAWPELQMIQYAQYTVSRLYDLDK
jgi:hypothetical protein